jgi:hypothetical protein
MKRVCKSIFHPSPAFAPLFLRVGALSLGPKGIDHRLPTMKTGHGRFTTRIGATVYEDNTHIVLKVRLEGGAIGTLVKERQVARDNQTSIALSSAKVPL